MELNGTNDTFGTRLSRPVGAWWNAAHLSPSVSRRGAAHPGLESLAPLERIGLNGTGSGSKCRQVARRIQTCEDSMVRLPNGPEELLNYFEDVNRDYPDQRHRDGAEMCRLWMNLKSLGASQSDVDEFRSRLRDSPHKGSAWLDLEMQFEKWALTREFR
jgi:hypothetical protein